MLYFNLEFSNSLNINSINIDDIPTKRLQKMVFYFNFFNILKVVFLKKSNVP